MYDRAIKAELVQLSEAYPIVTLIGPRQAGKTTLAKMAFPDKPYVNLEFLDIREMAHADPRSFLAQYPDGAILDEIQRAPALLPYLQGLVDERGQNGLFILTGSHQMSLHEEISQSLAGRTALLTLLPLSLDELKASGPIEYHLLYGGYPRIHAQNLDPTKAYRNYFQTYIEKDLRQLVQVKELALFQRFVRICAGRIGQLLNMDGIANEVGVSGKTVKEWISILEASFVIFRLHPYFENFGKRLIKSPKLYFTDVGLATYLLGITTQEQLERDPLRGHLIENLAILELMKKRLNQGLDPGLYFFRDTRGVEVDLICQSGRDLIPIEIKAAATFNTHFLKNLEAFSTIAEKRCRGGIVVYTGQAEQAVGPFHVRNIYSYAANV